MRPKENGQNAFLGICCFEQGMQWSVQKTPMLNTLLPGGFKNFVDSYSYSHWSVAPGAFYLTACIQVCYHPPWSQARFLACLQVASLQSVFQAASEHHSRLLPSACTPACFYRIYLVGKQPSSPEPASLQSAPVLKLTSFSSDSDLEEPEQSPLARTQATFSVANMAPDSVAQPAKDSALRSTLPSQAPGFQTAGTLNHTCPATQSLSCPVYILFASVLGVLPAPDQRFKPVCPTCSPSLRHWFSSVTISAAIKAEKQCILLLLVIIT